MTDDNVILISDDDDVSDGETNIAWTSAQESRVKKTQRSTTSSRRTGVTSTGGSSGKPQETKSTAQKTQPLLDDDPSDLPCLCEIFTQITTCVHCGRTASRTGATMEQVLQPTLEDAFNLPKENDYQSDKETEQREKGNESWRQKSTDKREITALNAAITTSTKKSHSIPKIVKQYSTPTHKPGGALSGTRASTTSARKATLRTARGILRIKTHKQLAREIQCILDDELPPLEWIFG